jgi:hemolysin-activating ACP:hemolysin acyltransferase
MLLRAGDGGGAAGSASPAEGLRLSAWKPKDASACLGLAVEFLSKMPAFARLPFGEWSQVLFYQVARGHCLFVVDQDQRVRGFLGWALTTRDLAEQWVEGRSGLRSDQCVDGDCVIINAFAAETDEARRFILDARRALFGSRRLYFKRHYADGRTRAARLSVDMCAGNRVAQSDRRLEQYEIVPRKKEEFA